MTRRESWGEAYVRRAPSRDPDRIPLMWCGVDLVDIPFITRSVAAGDAFLHNVYTDHELEACAGSLPQLAAHFAAKEAVAKALGTGFDGFGWRDVEVVPGRGGQQVVRLYGPAATRAKELRLSGCAVSFVCRGTHAFALAIAWAGDAG